MGSGRLADHSRRYAITDVPECNSPQAPLVYSIMGAIMIFMKAGVLGTGVLFLLISFFVPFFVHADIVISEIMYDFPGTEGSGDHDWIEVFNAGGSSVDLTGYRFFESNTNHTLKEVQGGVTLASGAYAVIANNPT